MIGEATTSSSGEWVFTSDKSLPSGSQTINLTAVNPDGATLESGSLVIMNVPDCSAPLEERAPAIAMLVPKDEAAGSLSGQGSPKQIGRASCRERVCKYV